MKLKLYPLYALSVIFLGHSLFAQPITYQGRISGTASAAIDIEATLYDAPSNGSVLGNIDSVEDVVVSNNLFTTEFDFGAVDYSQPLFLELRIRDGASTDPFSGIAPLLPRVEFSPVPIAYSVINDAVNDADSDPANELINEVALVGTELEINDAAGTKSVDLVSLVPAIPDGHSLDSVDGSLEDAVYVNTVGEVGVGRKNPDATLHVSGLPSLDSIILREIDTISIDLDDQDDELESLSISGDLAYLLHGEIGILEILDISDPDSVVSIKRDETLDLREPDIVVSGRYAYVLHLERFPTRSSILSIFDISDPNNIILLDSETFGSSDPKSLKVEGDFAYALTNELVIFDISDPSNIKELDSDNTYSFEDMAISGSFAYGVIDVNPGILAVLDVSDPRNIVPRGTVSTGFEDPFSIAVDRHFAFILDEDGYLTTFDISNPDNIIPLDSELIGGQLASVVVSRNIALVQSDGLEVFDVSDPGNIISIDSIGGSDGGQDLAVAGEFAYSATDEELDIFQFRKENAISRSLIVEGDSVLDGQLDVNGNVTASAFEGDGSALTGVTVNDVDDADADPTNELQSLTDVLNTGNDAGGQNITNAGAVTATSFSGNGSSLTGINLSQVLSSGNNAGGRNITNAGRVAATNLELNSGITDGLLIKTTNSSPWAIRILNETDTTGTGSYEAGMYMTNDGFFRVTNQIPVSGRNYAELDSTGTWSAVSDENRKRDFEPLTEILGKVLSLNPTSYFFKDAEGNAWGERHIGFTAQDVEEEFPSLVNTSEDLKTLNYSGLSVVAIAAMQELKAEKDAEINELKQENAELEERLERLESLLAID